MANKKRLVRDAKEIIKRLNSEYETMEEFCQVKAREIEEFLANLKLIWDKPLHSSYETGNRLSSLQNLALDVLEEYQEFQDKLHNVMSIHSEVMNVMRQFKNIYHGKKWSTLTRNDCLQLRRLLEEDPIIVNYRSLTYVEDLKKEFENGNYIQRAQECFEEMIAVHQATSRGC